MVIFKHLRNIFDSEVLDKGFPHLFLVSSHVVVSHILGFIAQVFYVAKLLALAKSLKSIWLILVGGILYQLVNKALCLYFHDIFFVDLLFHQFNMAIKEGAKAVVHTTQVVLDVHLIG
jgi:hypothetical protein